MNTNSRIILVTGATGQQGGSVATALNDSGWQVRTLVRDPGSAKALALSARGIETVTGDLNDAASLRAAMTGFSIQPSSGQGVYGISDADEVRFGISVADIAQEMDVQHLVYTSSNAAGANTGVGHFDSKFQIEAHIRGLAINYTIVRPSTFMEILLLPGFGLARGTVTFFMQPNQTMQFIAVRDIGQLVARVLADGPTYSGRTLELVGDTVTGTDLATKFSQVLRKPVAYQRFPDTALRDNAMLRELTRLVDEGPLAGRANSEALRAIYPGLLTVDAWLQESRQSVIDAA